MKITPQFTGTSAGPAAPLNYLSIKVLDLPEKLLKTF